MALRGRWFQGRLWVVLSAATIFLTAFKFLAYRDDAWISLKIVTNGTCLIMVAVFGIVFFGESITVCKIV